MYANCHANANTNVYQSNEIATADGNFHCALSRQAEMFFFPFSFYSFSLFVFFSFFSFFNFVQLFLLNIYFRFCVIRMLRMLFIEDCFVVVVIILLFIISLSILLRPIIAFYSHSIKCCFWNECDQKSGARARTSPSSIRTNCENEEKKKKKNDSGNSLEFHKQKSVFRFFVCLLFRCRFPLAINRCVDYRLWNDRRLSCRRMCYIFLYKIKNFINLRKTDEKEISNNHVWYPNANWALYKTNNFCNTYNMCGLSRRLHWRRFGICLHSSIFREFN